MCESEFDAAKALLSLPSSEPFTEETLSKAFKRAALRAHPDKNVGNADATAVGTRIL
jgi:curved DNA-binding protein CbpA